MNRLNDTELVAIIGGGLSGAIINSFLNAAKFVYNAGQAFGSSLRRIGGKSLCPLR